MLLLFFLKSICSQFSPLLQIIHCVSILELALNGVNTALEATFKTGKHMFSNVWKVSLFWNCIVSYFSKFLLYMFFIAFVCCHWRQNSVHFPKHIREWTLFWASIKSHWIYPALALYITYIGVCFFVALCFL